MSEPVREGHDRSLVVPMFDEAARIGVTIDKLRAWPSLARTEVVFVDDGSVDGTADVVAARLQDLGGRGRIVRLPENRGKGAAVRAGMLAASAQLVAFADADLSADLDEVDRCFAELEASGADVVLATRASFASDIVEAQPRLRQLSGQCFNLVLRVGGLTTFSDTQCGLKVFRRHAIEPLFEPLQTERFAFDVEVLLRAQRLGLKLHEVPIEWRHVEASRVSPVADGISMLRDAMRVRRSLGRRPAPVIVESMTDARFDVMARLEARHWWFRAKRKVVANAIARHSARQGGAAVDVGCGTGGTLLDLDRLGFAPLFGTDLSVYALRHAKRATGGADLITCRAEELPIADGGIAVLTSLDVVEHLDDDVRALQEYGRAVGDGLVVCSVPAYQWAWSDHDVVLGHRRRYRRAQLVAAAEAAGLEVLECRYFHHWLVVPALVLRRTPLRHVVRAEAESVSFVNPTINEVLWTWSRVEIALGRLLNMPFGLSILLVARVRDPG